MPFCLKAKYSCFAYDVVLVFTKLRDSSESSLRVGLCEAGAYPARFLLNFVKNSAKMTNTYVLDIIVICQLFRVDK
jgi:hypothetical protein